MNAPKVTNSTDPSNGQSAVFATHAPAYAAAGLVTFPAGSDKQPLVKSHLAFAPSTHSKLLGRFADANIGLVLAPKRGRGLTVVDVDTHNPSDTAAVVAECVKAFGDTPVRIATPGGGAHLWYQGSDLGRRIRPITGLPVDVLAGGIGMAPPSAKATGSSYSFRAGSLADVGRLPDINAEQAARLARTRPVITPADLMAALDRRIAKAKEETTPAPSPAAPSPVAWEAMGEGGGRNDALFRWGKERVQAAPDRDAFTAQLHARNATCGVPMPASEVDRISDSLWIYREGGRVMRGGEQSIVFSVAYLDLAKACPDALALLFMLKAAHGAKHGQPFALARPMAAAMGWSLPRWKQARDALIEIGELEIVSRGGRGRHDPPLARLLA